MLTFASSSTTTVNVSRSRLRAERRESYFQQKTPRRLLSDSAHLVFSKFRSSGQGLVLDVLPLLKSELCVLTHRELRRGYKGESPRGPVSHAGDSQEPRTRTSGALQRPLMVPGCALSLIWAERRPPRPRPPLGTKPFPG